MAALVLSDFGDDRAVNPLNKALKAKDKCIRERAASTLGRMRNEKASDPLNSVALNDPDNRVGDGTAQTKPQDAAAQIEQKVKSLWWACKTQGMGERAWQELIKMGEPTRLFMLQILKERDDLRPRGRSSHEFAQNMLKTLNSKTKRDL